MNMTPYFQQDGVTLYHGDCREILQGLPDESVSAIVTDPPYGLSFMGKKWDYDVPAVEVWAECLRVLKPGGHLLAFAGTRTQHRMATAIEDAGFEIRDMIAWVYGSGFPKSLDVSKAIDAQDAVEERRARALRFTAWMREACPLSASECNQIIGTKAEAGHYFTDGKQPHIAVAEHFDKLRPHFLVSVPEDIEEMVRQRTVESQTLKNREVVGYKTGQQHADGRKSCFDVAEKMIKVDVAITAPASPEAQQWAGWGTALKPALEPITVARKPLCGTVAENVLQHGTGGLNVDGCRVGTSKNVPASVSRHKVANTYNGGWNTGETPGVGGHDPNLGRWPANLIHDGSEEVVGLFPDAGGGYGVRGGRAGATVGDFGMGATMETVGFGDSGSAARFFYTAKADKSDRGPGNNHPTVKPVDLMRYLVRLVCPIGGVVLDPFSGSGTTLAAAQAEGCLAIGVEREAAYCEIIKGRFHQRRLF